METTLQKGGVREDLFEAVGPDAALGLLKAGNTRFTSDRTMELSNGDKTRKSLAERGQRPFACILGCSDSRVPPETVFDVGAGQLFVIRTAGNVADDIAIGSVEYAAEHLNVPLVVVMGHSGCGAVAATVSGEAVSRCIGAIVAEIKPSLDKVRASGGSNLAGRCEDENVQNTIRKLMSSPVLAKLVSEEKLKIVGAKYDLETGKAEFITV